MVEMMDTEHFSLDNHHVTALLLCYQAHCLPEVAIEVA